MRRVDGLMKEKSRACRCWPRFIARGFRSSGLTSIRQRSKPCTAAKTISSISANRLVKICWPRGGSTRPTIFAAGRGGRDHQLRARRRWARIWSRTLAYVEKTADDIAKTLRPGPARRAGIDDLSAHHARDHAAALRGAGLNAASISSSPIPPSAKTPAARISTRRRSPSSSAASTPASTEVAVALYRKAIKQVIPVSSRRSRRGGQAAGKHLPRREHRAGERDEDGADGDGHRRVGSDRGRQRPSRSASRRFIPARGWAGTAFRSIRFT